MRGVRSPWPILLTLWAGGCSGSPEVSATGLDSVTTPGVPARLTAKFERLVAGSHLRPDLPRERVTFHLPNTRIGDLTDRDGVAEATFIPRRAGVFPFRAKLDEHPRAKSARGKLFVVDPQRPVAIVDIDGTLSDLGMLRVVASGDRAQTFPGAPELIRDLSKTHQIVYLTARDDALDQKTRAFLSLHAFPSAPILYNDWGLSSPEARNQLRPSQHGKFKLHVLRVLQGRKLKVVLGIGDSDTDAQAYEAAGIKSYVRRPDPPQEKGKTAWFKDYAQLREWLVEAGVLKKKKEPPRTPKQTPRTPVKGQ